MSKQAIERAWNAVQFDQIDELKQLVPAIVSPNASTHNPNNHVHTLLMCAAAHGAEKCAEYLLENGADVNLKNFDGHSALHWAAYAGRTETLPLLLAHNADIEARTVDGRTPFHIAAFRGHIQFIEEFMKANPEINEIACNGWTALHFAVISNQKKMAEKLMALGVKAENTDIEGKSLEDLAEKYKRNWLREIIGKPQSD